MICFHEFYNYMMLMFEPLLMIKFRVFGYLIMAKFLLLKLNKNQMKANLQNFLKKIILTI